MCGRKFFFILLLFNERKYLSFFFGVCLMYESVAAHKHIKKLFFFIKMTSKLGRGFLHEHEMKF